MASADCSAAGELGSQALSLCPARGHPQAWGHTRDRLGLAQDMLPVPRQGCGELDTSPAAVLLGTSDPRG